MAKMARVAKVTRLAKKDKMTEMAIDASVSQNVQKLGFFWETRLAV